MAIPPKPEIPTPEVQHCKSCDTILVADVAYSDSPKPNEVTYHAEKVELGRINDPVGLYRPMFITALYCPNCRLMYRP